jgi:hypothetical protein
LNYATPLNVGGRYYHWVMTNPDNEKARQASIDAFLEKLNAGQRPDQSPYLPENTWDEIKPGLWLGGTHDEHDMRLVGNRNELPAIGPDEFDTVITMYAWAQPADWFVKEIRFGIYDGDMSDFETSALHDIVKIAHKDWRAGKKVLIRCQAGINRSGLVMALVLIRDGMSAAKAIQLMRDKRARSVLRNDIFEKWLLAIKPGEWRA